MKLLSFGEVLYDVYPDAAHIGGAPLNLAAHAAIHGDEVYLLSAVGDDALGRDALEQLRAWGIKTDYVSVLKEAPTGTCYVTLDNNGVPTYRLSDNVAWDSIPLPESAVQAQVISFGTLALRSEHNRRCLASLLAANAFEEVLADVNLRAPFFDEESVHFALSHATILKLSDEDWQQMRAFVPQVAQTAGEAVCRALASLFSNLRVVLWTEGAKGACALDTASGAFYRVAAIKTTVRSTVGAGDSFSASFLSRFRQGHPLPTCVEHAVAVAATVVGHEEAVPSYDPNALG